MNIVELVPLWHGGASFGYIPKSDMAGSSGRDEMFKVLSDQRNANQNDPEIPPYTNQNG